MGKARSFFFIIILLVQYSYGQNTRNYYLPQSIDETDYSSTQIVVKIKSTSPANARTNVSGRTDIQTLIQEVGAVGYEPIIKGNALINQRQKDHSLSGVYKVHLNPGQDPIKTIKSFLKNPEVLYAEPYYNHRLLFVPNDPESQTNKMQGPYLSLINAYEAWDLTRGDSTIIVAVLDTGTKLNHEDLEDNLWINYADPVNGIDDDGDGLVDNYFGYDFADDDNDPTADIDGHGAEVAGVSNATTNNSTGISGIGFNSKYMPLKIFRSDNNSFLNGYEAIIFAADKGAKVINLSWGSEDSFTQFGQDAINYAVLEKDAVVVAAAGNTNGELDFYPASFENVLSVGATNNEDEKTSWGTFSYKIDLMAPGQGIYTTRGDGDYGSNDGTSLSSPLVAGAAALLRSYAPDLNAKQVMEKIRITSQDIYEIPANQPYHGQLGNGRLDVLNMLTDNISPSVRFENMTYDNKNGSFAYYSDTLTIDGDFVNYLKPTQNLTVTLSSESSFISILDSIFIAGSMSTLDSVSVSESPFKIILAEDTPPDTRLLMKLNYKDGFYEDFQYVQIYSSPDYIDVHKNSITTTISGNGNLGYQMDGYSGGVGFTFENENILEHIGLVLGTDDPLYLSNNSITVFDSAYRDQDFEGIDYIKFYNNSVAETDLRSSFKEDIALLNPIGIKIDQKMITSDSTTGDFFILEYRMINQSGSTITNLHTSLFADWELEVNDFNIAVWSHDDSLGYVYYPDTDSIYASVALLTPQIPIHSAQIREDLGDTLDRAEKHSNISQGVLNSGAASLGNEENVSQFVGGTIANLAPDQTEKIAFALTAGKTFEEIKANTDSARLYYSFYKANPPLGYIAYACEGESVLIDPPGTLYDFYEDIELSTLISSGETFMTAPITGPYIFYAINKDQPYDSEVIQMKADIKSLDPEFIMNPDSVYLDESGDNHAHFQDLSKDAVLWNWDFDNGFSSSIKEPSTSYFTPGEYEVRLYVENDIGCADSITKQLTVLQRAPKPLLDPQLVCSGDNVNLDPSNADQIRVYSELELINMLYEGDSFTSGLISSDTVFFVTNMDTGIESLATKAIVTITGLSAEYVLSLDTTNLDKKYLLNLTNSSQYADTFEWFLDDELYSTAPDTLLDYMDLSNFEMKLEVTDSLGCTMEMTKSLMPVQSPMPILDVPVMICPFESISLIPSGAEVFYFYTDPELSTLIHKGSSLTLDSLDFSTDIYLISMDSLFDSDTLHIPIAVSTLTADFDIMPDTLNLTEGSTVQFEALSEEATSWFWDFDNGQTDSIQSPVVSFDEPGEYMIFLRTKNETGCVITKETMLPVVSVLALEEQINRSQTIYPNPSQGKITVSFNQQVLGKSTVALFNNAGVLVMKKSILIESSEIDIDLSSFPEGIYYLQFQNEFNTFTEKLVLE